MLNYTANHSALLRQSPEIVLSAWEEEEIRRNHLKGTEIFLSDAQDFIRLICFDKFTCKLLQARTSLFSQCHDEIVI